MSCLRTTTLIEAWPINYAQNKFQVLCGRRFPSPLHFLYDASAAKGMTSVGCLILHASIYFLRPIDLPAVDKRNMHTFADRLWVFAFESENVGKERFYTRVGHGRHRRPASLTIYHPPVANYSNWARAARWLSESAGSRVPRSD
jgi:hypothetical protein